MKTNFNSKELENFDYMGDNHIGTASDTPIRKDAFRLNADEKIEIIRDDVKHIMETLGLDLSDDSLMGTPNSCLLYTSPSPRDGLLSRMPSSA